MTRMRFQMIQPESIDTDGDGIGNNSDPDDDDDGVCLISQMHTR